MQVKLSILFFILFAEFCFSKQPTDSVYLEAKNSKVALILAHGRGGNPTWKVVNPIRKAVHKRINFHTLSLQMPNEDKKFEEYAFDFEEAYKRIDNAIIFLKQEKNVNKIFLFGHSMGSRMVSSYIKNNPSKKLAGVIIVGCRNNNGIPFSCIENIKDTRLPILDIWGNSNKKDKNSAKKRKYLISNSYTQIPILGANHKFNGFEQELKDAVILWLEEENKK